MTDVEGKEKRRYVRCTVYQPCTATIDSQEFSCAVVDMSVDGATLRQAEYPVCRAMSAPVAYSDKMLHRAVSASSIPAFPDLGPASAGPLFRLVPPA